VNIPDKIMGGVITFTNEHYEKVNGFSNKYVGWGKEDDDLYLRCERENLAPYKHPFGRYYSVPHKLRLSDDNEKEMHKKNGETYSKFFENGVNHKIEGLNTTDFKILLTKILHEKIILYIVDINNFVIETPTATPTETPTPTVTNTPTITQTPTPTSTPTPTPTPTGTTTPTPTPTITETSTETETAVVVDIPVVENKNSWASNFSFIQNLFKK
jgi:hypothetical protein